MWLERGVIDAADQRLLNSPLGLAGHTTLATLVLATGTALDRTRREQALDAARAVLQAHPGRHRWRHQPAPASGGGARAGAPGSPPCN